MVAELAPQNALIAREWMRRNLFSNRWNVVLTVVTVIALAFGAYSFIRFVFVFANWDSVVVNRRLLFLATFPADAEWRLWPPLWLFAAIAGLAYALWSSISRYELAIGTIACVALFLFLAEGSNGLLVAATILVSVCGYVSGRWLLNSKFDTLARQVAIGGGVAILPLALFLFYVGDGVRSSEWGGVMLNIMLATVGIGFGFPIGVLLALGRASSLPVVSLVCSVYIEFVRAGPLILWLAMARFVLPDFLPSIAGLDEIDLVGRAMMVLAGFSAAYIAEVVRGGLQSIPNGQREAADSLGLNAAQATWHIILPQALRAVIPALVNRFVSLWKDTSLVVVLGFVDLLGAARAVSAQPDFVGRQAEALLFAALIFWTVAFTMSRLSQRIEHHLGVGER